MLIAIASWLGYRQHMRLGRVQEAMEVTVLSGTAYRRHQFPGKGVGTSPNDMPGDLEVLRESQQGTINGTMYRNTIATVEPVEHQEPRARGLRSYQCTIGKTCGKLRWTHLRWLTSLAPPCGEGADDYHECNNAEARGSDIKNERSPGTPLCGIWSS